MLKGLIKTEVFLGLDEGLQVAYATGVWTEYLWPVHSERLVKIKS